jgi:hypothetical protein
MARSAKAINVSKSPLPLARAFYRRLREPERQTKKNPEDYSSGFRELKLRRFEQFIQDERKARDRQDDEE